MSQTVAVKKTLNLHNVWFYICSVLFVLIITGHFHPDFLTGSEHPDLKLNRHVSLSVTSCLWLSARSSLVTEDLYLLKLPANKQINQLSNSDSDFEETCITLYLKQLRGTLICCCFRPSDCRLCELVLNVREGKISSHCVCFVNSAVCRRHDG